VAPQGDKGKGKEAEQSKPMGGPAMAKPAADALLLAQRRETLLPRELRT